MLASLDLPYTLDTGETITHGTCMECLFVITRPKPKARRIWFITAPHHTKHGAALRKVAYSMITERKLATKFIRALLFVFSRGAPPAWVSPGVARRCRGGPAGAPGHCTRLRETLEAWTSRRAAEKGRLPIP